MQNTWIKCQECGGQLSEGQQSCPSCGSDKLSYEAEFRTAVGMLPSIGVKLKDKKGRIQFQSKDRNKISGTTKRKAHETMIFDRTDPKFTKKFHHVEEINENNQPEVVHHEETVYPAKRRPNT